MDEHPPLREQTIAAAVEQTRVEMDHEFDQETLELFQNLLNRLWDRLAGVMGAPTTGAILFNARRETVPDHPFLAYLDIAENSVSLERLRAHLDGVGRAALCEGLLAYVDSVVSLIADLTGDILVAKLLPWLHDFTARLEE